MNPRIRKTWTWMWALYTSLGICVILWARVYQFFWHPEWTESQAGQEMWLAYGLGLFLIGLAGLISVMLEKEWRE